MDLYDKYYDYIVEDEKDVSIEERLVFELFHDASGRSGMIDDIDSDIQNEILTEWVDLVRINLNEWIIKMGNKHLNLD